MSREGVIELLGSAWTDMLAILHDGLKSDVDLLNRINQGILSHSGKLMRPMICLLISKALGTPNQDSIRYAAACEMLHNATLIHDDVADESEERRGNPTISALLGPSGAVLVGDFWLARTVSMVMSAENNPRVVKYFCNTLGALAEGEMLQMEKAESADTREEDYYKIIKGKTASLFEASGASAAESVGAGEELCEAAREFALCFGIAFQIKDDILDYAGTSQLGKPVGVDLKEQKITLPLLGALKGAENEQEIRQKVRDIKTQPGNEAIIREFVEQRGGISYAKEQLDAYITRAKEALSVFPDSEAKDYLMQIADFNTFRQV